MVRFIISLIQPTFDFSKAFTFQYGQIYYVNIYKQRKEKLNDLHSNMVRFIIGNQSGHGLSVSSFTFQYGQIYYEAYVYKTRDDIRIYIPIWLDLLSKRHRKNKTRHIDLHSNMVRFIINNQPLNLSPHFTIYIPIWLDLLFH